MMMKNPCHPSVLIRAELLEGYQLPLQEAAKMLGISHKTLANFFERQTRLSPNLAYRLELAGINTARFWLGLQANYDLAQFVNSRTKTPQVDAEKFAKIRKQIEQEMETADNEFGNTSFAEITPVNVKRIREHAPSRAHAHA